MKKQLKRILALALAVCCLACLMPLSFAAEGDKGVTAELFGVKLEGILAADGTLSIKLNGDQLKALIKAREEDTIIKLDFSSIPDVKALIVTLDPAAIAESYKSFSAGFNGYALRVGPEFLSRLSERYPGEVSLGLRASGVEVTLTQADKDINWYDYSLPMTVTMPAASGSEHLVLRDMSTQGIVARSYYAEGFVSGKVYKAGKWNAATAKLATFTDLSGDLEAKASFLQARGIINGVGEGKFDPARPVTRAELLTMVMRAVNPEPQGAWMVMQFADAESGSYYYDALLKAKAMGFTKGVGDNRFNPDATITRQDMIVLLHNVMGKSGMLPETMTLEYLVFDDEADIAPYASNAIQTLAKLKVISAQDGKIAPLTLVTRQEAAEALYNMLKSDAKN